MNFQNVLLAGAGLIAGLLTQGNVNAQDSNQWAPANVRIDGQPTEWPKPLQFYNNDTKLFYTIANDKENLYVIVSVPDAQSQVKIMRSGLTFSVNASGKKKGGASLTFPLITEAAVTPDVPEESRQRVAAEWKKQSLANVKEIKVDGFTGVTDGNIPTDNKFGIRAAASLDAAGNLVCEFALPLSAAGITPGTDKPVAYHFRVNALNKEELKERQKAAAKAQQGQGQGQPPMPGQMQDMITLYYPSDFWTRQTLAIHQ
ncbi:MAG TPA: hypothetical protein VM802_02965 [Chitinophaga sp.]|uniref:hypothetical protein n=1 Tax=Chitinophaga sp. TaxID=1869181 RepID=UPI002BB2A4F8|nr:hypothetical protein [Chitinophaga sp.]HVI43795.1 hypothetical protein [Chitinophaga sp.]